MELDRVMENKRRVLVLVIAVLALSLFVSPAQRANRLTVRATDKPPLQGWLYDQWYIPRWNAYGQWIGYDRMWGAAYAYVRYEETGPVGSGLMNCYILAAAFVSDPSICVDDSHPFKLPLKIPTAAGSANALTMYFWANIFPAATTIYIDSTRIGVSLPLQYASRNPGNYEVKWYPWTYWPFRAYQAILEVDYTNDILWWTGKP
jgi:hypothetical protein